MCCCCREHGPRGAGGRVCCLNLVVDESYYYYVVCFFGPQRIFLENCGRVSHSLARSTALLVCCAFPHTRTMTYRVHVHFWVHTTQHKPNPTHIRIFHPHMAVTTTGIPKKWHNPSLLGTYYYYYELLVVTGGSLILLEFFRCRLLLLALVVVACHNSIICQLRYTVHVPYAFHVTNENK